MASRQPATPRALARRLAALNLFKLQLRVELQVVKPLVWRRLLVPETVTLPKLHLILQAAMGWSNSHLHEYDIARQRYGIPDDDWAGGEQVIDERRVRLKPLVESGLRKFTYAYDFGDGWEHTIKVEDLALAKDGEAPVVCIAGENACPPEDVGGPHSYGEFLETLKDPAHEDHADMLRWVGGAFDPTAFSLAAVNERLATIRV